MLSVGRIVPLRLCGDAIICISRDTENLKRRGLAPLRCVDFYHSGLAGSNFMRGDFILGGKP